MASHAPDFGRASALPLSAVLASARTYPRPVIERLCQRLIDHLDEQDGDPDEEDATDAEDEGLSIAVRVWAADSGPGCKIAEPKEDDDPKEDSGELEPADWVSPEWGGVR